MEEVMKSSGWGHVGTKIALRRKRVRVLLSCQEHTCCYLGAVNTQPSPGQREEKEEKIVK